MGAEHIEKRNGNYYVAGTRISLDSVVYSFCRGNSPETIQEEYPLLSIAQIRNAIAFYQSHREAVDQYLDDKLREFEASAIPLCDANPELWARIEQARRVSSPVDMGEPRAARVVSVQMAA